MAHIFQLPARERVIRARTALIMSAPFFGALALHLDVVERPDVGTMAVDQNALYYAPDYVATLSEPELIGVWVHEVLHLALLHHVRRGSREAELWNDAADYAINPQVDAAGFTLPANVLRDPAYSGMPAEQIYSVLAAKRQQEQQQGGGAGAGAGAGSGAPQPGDGKARPGAVLDAAPQGASMAEAAAEMESRVRQATSIAASQNAGEMPGAAARLLAELNAPRVSWRDVVARFVDDAATRVTDWMRPNRRFIGSGFYLPGSTRDSVGLIAVAVDTSGSVTADQLRAFGSEIQGILDSGKVERVRVVFCDSVVQGAQEFAAGDLVQLDAKGGGGTRFAPAFRDIALHAPEAAAILYATDLECRAGDWGTEPAAPVLWLATGTKRAAPFGEVIPLDAYA